MEITFNNLPEAVTQLRTDVSEIKRLLLEKSNEQHHTEPDKLLTIQQAGELLSLSVVYSLDTGIYIKTVFFKDGTFSSEKYFFTRE